MRMLTFEVEFDVKPWAKWAESAGIRGEFINFALLNPEIFDRGHIINARSYTLFANSLNSVKDLSTTESMGLASLIASGSFGEDGTYLAGMFTQFINNKLDKLITPEQMLKQEWKKVVESLLDNIYKDNSFRADVASVLTLRFCNYCLKYFGVETDKDKKKAGIKRVEQLILYKDDQGRLLLTEDLILKLVSELNYKYTTLCKPLISNPSIATKLF